jgi:hypothetical protein
VEVMVAHASTLSLNRLLGLGIRSIMVIQFSLFVFVKFRILKNENLEPDRTPRVTPRGAFG